jgi:microcystin-dependent protein
MIQMNKLARTAGAAAVLLALSAGVQAPAQAQGGGNPLLGQLMYVAFNFAPKGWALCNGQTLAISTNTALFSLLGTNYGGNGTSNFQLPNMQGRVPVHFGQGLGLSNYTLGESGGTETVTLTTSNLPSHSHSVSFTAQVPASSGAATGVVPAGNNPANSVHTLNYSTAAPNVSLGSTVTISGTTGLAGGGQPMSIMQPYTTLNCVIALQGVFPSRN